MSQNLYLTFVLFCPYPSAFWNITENIANIGGRATYAARKKHENRKLKKFDRKIMLHAHEELKVESHTLS